MNNIFDEREAGRREILIKCKYCRSAGAYMSPRGAQLMVRAVQDVEHQTL